MNEVSANRESQRLGEGRGSTGPRTVEILSMLLNMNGMMDGKSSILAFERFIARRIP
jgi:hypothetical protein